MGTDTAEVTTGLRKNYVVIDVVIFLMFVLILFSSLPIFSSLFLGYTKCRTRFARNVIFYDSSAHNKKRVSDDLHSFRQSTRVCNKKCGFSYRVPKLLFATPSVCIDLNDLFFIHGGVFYGGILRFSS